MKRIRVLMMLTTLLATASAVHAQSPPAYILPQPSQPQTESVCPAKAATTWYMQTLQDGTATFQRIRALCTAGQQSAVCCETGDVRAKGGVAVGIVGSVKCCEAVQATKECCCAKACACCESCKVKKDAIVRVLPQPAPWRAAPPLPPPFIVGTPNCVVAGTPNLVVGHTPNVVQVVPVAPVRVVQIMQVAHQAKPAHFATPDLDAHCERITHCGDHVLLEGNVLLLCKKHAQPIRIEAQRVKINMKDGTYTVESNSRTAVTTSYGVLRSTAVENVEMTMPIRNALPQRSAPIRPASAERGIAIPVNQAVTPEMLLELLRSLNSRD